MAAWLLGLLIERNDRRHREQAISARHQLSGLQTPWHSDSWHRILVDQGYDRSDCRSPHAYRFKRKERSVRVGPECDIDDCERSSIMNVIILEPISETLLSITATTTLALNVDKTVGWKTEAQRLAQGANRRAREPRQ
jgi:hypothetical protein